MQPYKTSSLQAVCDRHHSVSTMSLVFNIPAFIFHFLLYFCCFCYCWCCRRYLVYNAFYLFSALLLLRFIGLLLPRLIDFSIIFFLTERSFVSIGPVNSPGYMKFSIPGLQAYLLCDKNCCRGLHLPVKWRSGQQRTRGWHVADMQQQQTKQKWAGNHLWLHEKSLDLTIKE